MTTAPEGLAFSRPHLGEEEVQAVTDVLRSGWIVGGPRLAELERGFAEICGSRQAVGVSSWTTGAFLVLHALGVGPGDEVIVPSLTFIASVNVIRHVGATPVFADVDPDTWNVDPADVAKKVTSRTKALLPVDQIGLPCDLPALTAVADHHGLLLIEDAACAVGASRDGRSVGSEAPVSVFSLHARKVVTTGEGGIITTDDEALAERLRRLRHQGMSLSDSARHNSAPTVFEDYPEIGFNFRLTDLQAAVGVCQLERLPAMMAARRQVADRYAERLRSCEHLQLPTVPPGVVPNWQSYMVVLRDSAPLGRNALMDSLYASGIPTRRAVMASHLEPPYADPEHQLPVTEHVAGNGFLLPMHADLTTEQQDYVVDVLEELLAGG